MLIIDSAELKKKKDIFEASLDRQPALLPTSLNIDIFIHGPSSPIQTRKVPFGVMRKGKTIHRRPFPEPEHRFCV